LEAGWQALPRNRLCLERTRARLLGCKVVV